MPVRLDKIDGFFRVCGGESGYLVFFYYGLFDMIFDETKYLISEKGGIIDSINLNFKTIRTDSYNC